MRTRIFDFIGSIVLSLFALCAAAQSEPEYMMEIGAGLGLTSFQSDYNGSIVGDMQPSVDITWRYLFNPRMALKLDSEYATLKHGKSVSTNKIDLTAMYEYNFWPYGTGLDYRGARRLTNYIGLGLGATYYNNSNYNGVAMNLPLSIGLKYKITRRLNANLEWTVRFTTSDKLDGAVDPRDIVSSGAFKNKDGYSTLGIRLTYSFKERCRTCHNDDE